MTKFAINRDGSVTTYGAALEAKTWEGGVETDEKHYKPKNIPLRAQERMRLNKFMGSKSVRDYLASRPEKIRDDVRAILKDTAAKELDDVFKASLARVKEGKEELGAEEYQLHFNPQTSIVISEHRLKAERENQREAQRTAIQMANEVFEI